MFLSPPHEGHPVLHVLEEVCLLDRKVLVHYLEELPVSEDVWGADLDSHGGQFVQGSLEPRVNFFSQLTGIIS